MKKIRTILLFIFVVAGLINFLGVGYFKSSNITSFKNYINFCANNEEQLKKLETSSQLKEEILQITGVYRAFQEKGINLPKDMIKYHIKNVRKGAPVINNYYELYKIGKIYDTQVERGKNLIKMNSSASKNF